MNRRPVLIATIAATVIQLVVTAWAWVQIPDGEQVPIHWNIDGQADGFASKAVGLLLLPLATIGLGALGYLLPRFEPRGGLLRSSRAWTTVWIAILAMLTVLQVAIVLAALDTTIDVATVSMLGVGAVLVVVGNVMGKVRSNFFMGVRTPWTLSSDLSWNRTNRMGGRLFVAIGLAVIVLTVAGQAVAALWVMLGALLGGVVWLFWYSYRTWKNDPERRPASWSGES